MLKRSSLSIVAGLSLLVVASCGQTREADSFSRVCNIIAANAPLKSDAQQEQDKKMALIWKTIDAEISGDAPGRIAFEAVVNAAPEKKYQLYQTAARQHLGTEWSCPAWQALSDW